MEPVFLTRARRNVDAIKVTVGSSNVAGLESELDAALGAYDSTEGSIRLLYHR